MFFTDGSKTEAKVGASVIYSNNKTMIKILDFCLIYIILIIAYPVQKKLLSKTI